MKPPRSVWLAAFLAWLTTNGFGTLLVICIVDLREGGVRWLNDPFYALTNAGGILLLSLGFSWPAIFLVGLYYRWLAGRTERELVPQQRVFYTIAATLVTIGVVVAGFAAYVGTEAVWLLLPWMLSAPLCVFYWGRRWVVPRPE